MNCAGVKSQGINGDNIALYHMNKKKKKRSRKILKAFDNNKRGK